MHRDSKVPRRRDCRTSRHTDGDARLISPSASKALPSPCPPGARAREREASAVESSNRRPPFRSRRVAARNSLQTIPFRESVDAIRCLGALPAPPVAPRDSVRPDALRHGAEPDGLRRHELPPRRRRENMQVPCANSTRILFYEVHHIRAISKLSEI